MPDHKSTTCECGYEISARDETARVDEIRSHAREAHGIEFSVEDALLVLLRSELDVSRVSSKSGTHGGAQ